MTGTASRLAIGALAVCLASCGEAPLTLVGASVRMDPSLAGATEKLAIYVVGPKRSDGKFVTCQSLMNKTILVTDDLLDDLGHAVVRLVDLPANDRFAVNGVSSGVGRVVYIEALSSSDVVVASGCVEEVSVGEGATVIVPVTLYKPRQ
jgi:hypothetical protein